MILKSKKRIPKLVKRFIKLDCRKLWIIQHWMRQSKDLRMRWRRLEWRLIMMTRLQIMIWVTRLWLCSSLQRIKRILFLRLLLQRHRRLKIRLGVKYQLCLDQLQILKVQDLKGFLMLQGQAERHQLLKIWN